MVAEKKKLQELKKKSYTEAKKLRKMQKVNRQARPKICNFYKKEGHFFWDCLKMRSCGKSVQALRETPRLCLHALS